MTKLFNLMAIVMPLAYIAHVLSLRDANTGAYIKKNRSVWIMIAVIMILFAGLRTWYNDTGVYISQYNAIKVSSEDLFQVDWRLGRNPGFSVTNNILSYLGVSAQSFLLFYSAITIAIFLWFIRKYSDNLWLSAYLFIVIGPYLFSLAAVKQCFAMALCAVGVDRAIRKKWGSFVLWVLLATLFHPYSLMYFIVPLMMYCPWSWKSYAILGLFIIIGFMLQPLLGTVIDITALLGEEFEEAALAGEGVNPFRFAVMLVPTVLSFFLQKAIRLRGDRTYNFFVNLTMINGAIMFVALFGTANYFARLAKYFVIFQSLSLPWLLSCFEPKSKKLITAAAVICYALFLYYDCGVVLPFDENYRSISLLQYIHSFF